MPDNARIAKLPPARTLLDWFSAHKRPLPWRAHYEPYAVWVSEVMLQQTQMDRAVGYFTRWMQRFPDPAALAEADEDEVFALWEGLGYYNRARNLMKAARRIVAEHAGEVPEDHDALIALPGVGPYTAAAVASIAFNQPVPVVDANVERVFARLLDIDAPVKQKAAARIIRDAALAWMPEHSARDYNQALMELGALVCAPRAPRCSACPVRSGCEAHRLDIVLERPVPKKAAEYIPLEVATGVLIHDGRIFIQKRPENGVWGGLWEFPGGCVETGETPAQAVAREYMEETGFTVHGLERIAVVRHGYTKYRVALHCYFCELAHPPREPVLTAAQECRWVTPEELNGFAFPAGHRKLIDMLSRDLRFTTRLAR